MGLDMYLSKKTFIGAEYKHRNVKGKIDIKINDVPVKIDFKQVSYIIESVGYWRKANAIHAWFVKNVQDGVDECQESYVSYEQLIELRDLCKKVIKTKNAELLPPQAGFFFGSTEVDEYYMEDLKETVKIINALDPDGEYVYRASW
jgi:hypothetical protein